MTLACAGQMFLPCSIPATIWSSIIASFSTVCSSNSSRCARKRTRLFGLPKCSFMIMAAMMVFPAPTAATSSRFSTLFSHRPKQHLTASPWYGRNCTFIGCAANTNGRSLNYMRPAPFLGRGAQFAATFSVCKRVTCRRGCAFRRASGSPLWWPVWACSPRRGRDWAAGRCSDRE